MATAIYFDGRRINRPGAYSKIDASALADVAPGAVGIVALLGTAEGGKPLSIDPQFSDATTPEQVRSRYRSGDLRIAAEFAFAPSQDEAVPGGAQRVVAVKVNPATQSAASLSDSLANPSLDLLSRDWGLFTSQINVSIGDGSTQGKMVTVVFEDTTETFDNVGGDSILELEYTPGADGYTTALASITATQFLVAATKTGMAGLSTQLTAQPSAASVLSVASNNAGDTTQILTVYGLDAAAAPIQETFALNGTTPVVGVVSFTQVTGALLSAVAAGTVTLSDDDPATILTLAAGTTTRGLRLPTNLPAAGVITLTSSADLAGSNVVVRGLNASGSAIARRFNLATASSVPVVDTVEFSRIDHFELGDMPAANTFQISLNAVSIAHASFSTLQRLVDRLNMLGGMAATALVSNPTTYQTADADYASPASIVSTALAFSGDLYAVISALNSLSQFVTATRASGATAPPANVGPVYLTGGTEGAVTATEWQAAFSLLKKRRVNVIVPLTNDAAIQALLGAHLKERAGKLRSEANGYVGLGTVAGAGDTRANIKSRIQTLQTRHISAIAQEVQRPHPITLEQQFWPPYIFAAIAAGMQAGSPIAEPLTHKLIQASDLRNDSSWDVVNDESEMIDAGLMLAEVSDGVGVRWVRSITTHIADDNLAYVEMSMNESLNTAVFEFRRTLETIFAGKRGLGATVGDMKAKATDTLDGLVRDEIIFGYRSLSVVQIGDTFPISLELAPVGPINFIPITVHVVLPVSAAA
jgi:hypothetical protein